MACLLKISKHKKEQKRTCLLFSPSFGCGRLRYFRSPLRRRSLDAGRATLRAKRLGAGVVAIIGDCVGLPACRYPHDEDSVADYVSGALLAFAASGHVNGPSFQ